MARPRTAWHYYFWLLLRERGPKSFEIRAEIPIGEELPRADYLLLRKREHAIEDDSAQTLVGLWPRLPRETVAELKSTGRPYRRRDLFKLLAYAYRHFAGTKALATLSELACVLIVPIGTKPLLDDLEALSLKLNESDDGYSHLRGAGQLQLLLVEIDKVTEAENDDVLRLFSHQQERTIEGRRWWARRVGADEMKAQELEGYDEVIAKFLGHLSPEQRLAGLKPEQYLAPLSPEQRLAGLEPEQRLAGLEPEQRLAGLEPEQYLLTLPIEVLRGLKGDYLDTLPPELRDSILKRIASGS